MGGVYGGGIQSPAAERTIFDDGLNPSIAGLQPEGVREFVVYVVCEKTSSPFKLKDMALG